MKATMLIGWKQTNCIYMCIIILLTTLICKYEYVNDSWGNIEEYEEATIKWNVNCNCKMLSKYNN